MHISVFSNTSVNNQNKLSFSLKNVFQNSFPSIKYHCTTTKKIENIIMSKPFCYQLMHIMLKNTELLKHSKITLQHVSVYVETIFRELQSVLG